MSIQKSMHKFAVCCLNISEGRNVELINRIAYSAVQHQPPSSQSKHFKCETTVLSVYSDPIFNRSNITIASTVENLAQSVYNACSVAYQNIDLCQHLDPKHPRLGVIDLIPIHPISPSTSVEECSHVAHQIGHLITSNFPSQASVFYFGKADQENRDLVQRRKELSWFSNNEDSIIPDLGVFTKGFGITGIGALPYMTVLNVLLDTNDIQLGKNIAINIRHRNRVTGLKGIQAMAFLKENKVEIACNVDTNDLQSEVNNLFYSQFFLTKFLYLTHLFPICISTFLR